MTWKRASFFIKMTRPYLIPFTLRAKPGYFIRKVLLNESDITTVYVDKYSILVTMRSSGQTWVNRNPSKTDFRFWQNYKRSAEKLETVQRWDMPSPDPLTLEELR